jgi:hypothetical protein
VSRQAEDREDLFAEASALTRRIELALPDEQESIVAGCRSTGAWSIYFGGDPCYHFDSDGRLRRAFVDGLLYRTQGETLARLTRVHTGESVELRRSDLDDHDRDAFLQSMNLRLQRLQQAVENGDFTIRRQHPEGDDVLSSLTSMLTNLSKTGPELAPAIPTRKH